MSVYALHEHELREDADPAQYEKEVQHAINKLKVPGLLCGYHLKGIKGEREHKYSVLWIFENESVLIANFGTPENPKFPKDWLYYENEVLAKFLDRDPDTINYTDYHVLSNFQFR